VLAHEHQRVRRVRLQLRSPTSRLVPKSNVAFIVWHPWSAQKWRGCVTVEQLNGGGPQTGRLRHGLLVLPILSKDGLVAQLLDRVTRKVAVVLSTNSKNAMHGVSTRDLRRA
jgi:hypothetical protein